MGNLRDKPKIGDMIKRGTYGSLYQVTNTDKKMLAYDFPNNSFSNKVVRELIKLDNETIIKIYSHANNLFVMEFAECGTLYNYLHGEEQREYTVRDVFNWSFQFAKGLGYLHSKEFIVFNVNSQSLLLSDNFHRLKINLISVWSMVGMRYEPEENLRITLEEKRDVYSFGIVLCELLTRKNPFYLMGRLEDDIFDYKKIGPFLEVGYTKQVDCQLLELSIQCCQSILSKRPQLEELGPSLRQYKSRYYSISHLELFSTISANIGAVVNCRDIGEFEKIGEGSFGSHYKLKWLIQRYTQMGSEHVIKLCDLKEIKKDATKVAYLKLINKLMHLRHENVLDVYGIVVDREPAALLIECTSLKSLHNYLYGEEQEEYSVNTVLDLMYQAALGITHLFEEIGFVQFILKPKNMLIYSYYNRNIMKISDYWYSEANSMTENMDTVYIAPEIPELSGNTIEGLVYNFGIVFWEAMARMRPFHHLEDQSPLSIAQAVKKGERPLISEMMESDCDLIKPLIKSCWDEYSHLRLLYSLLTFLLHKPKTHKDLEYFLLREMRFVDFRNFTVLENIERSVYKAVWYKKIIAVKKYKDDCDITFMKSFKYDMELATLLHSDNILRLLGITFDDEYSYILMEYSECGSLHNYLHGDEHREYSVNDGLEWMHQASKGIRDLVKRRKRLSYNISTKNMMLFKNCKLLKISDYCYPTDYFSNRSLVTPYTAPEVARGEDYTDKSYVYSLGIVFWEIMSRKNPLDHFKEIKFQKDERPSLDDIRKYGYTDIQKWTYGRIKQLIQKCWAHDTIERPTLEELCESLCDIKEVDEPEIDTSEIVNCRNSWKCVGAGGFGVVYKAIWNYYVIAVKEFSNIVDESNAEDLKSFDREAKQLSRVNHINIVKLLDYEMIDKSAYIFMEYAECGSLHTYLHGVEKLEYTVKMAIDWMSQCRDGIAYLHSTTPQPMIHRDLKPHNLLLTDEFRTLKIGDFGTVTDLKSRMTRECGTTAYTAPEVMKGEHYSEKCDIYSFGMILWEVLARKKPFYFLPNSTTAAITFNVSNGVRPAVEDMQIKDDCFLNMQVAEVLKACWDEDLKARPSADSIHIRVGTQICQRVIYANQS